VIRTFFMEAFRIPSGSMIPTLLVGDFLFVNKLAYGPHIPFSGVTGVLLPGYAEPERNDLAVYRSPDARDGHPTVVKRIVAIAGDTIHMRQGQLFVNGDPQTRSFGAVENPMQANFSDPDFIWQHRASLDETRFGPPPMRPTFDTWGPLLVPENHFFSLGDNRHNSKDARHYGFVPRNNLRGRPLVIYFSYEGEDTDSPLPFITDIRWRRIGSRIR
jgi:signal peptidase I